MSFFELKTNIGLKERECIHPISNKPKFESRIVQRKNVWINSFTGAVGDKYMARKSIFKL